MENPLGRANIYKFLSGFYKYSKGCTKLHKNFFNFWFEELCQIESSVMDGMKNSQKFKLWQPI